jgi:hypothetical protein
MNSDHIINALTSSYRNYIGLQPTGSGVIVEGYYIEPSRLEEGGDLQDMSIPKARVSIYEDGDQPNLVVDRMLVLDTIQRYGVDINYVIGYKKDKNGNAENPMLALKDSVIAWVNQTDFFSTTSGMLYYMQYVGSIQPTRDIRYTTIKLNFEARRIMLDTTTVYLTDSNGNQLTDNLGNLLTQ